MSENHSHYVTETVTIVNVKVTVFPAPSCPRSSPGHDGSSGHDSSNERGILSSKPAPHGFQLSHKLRYCRQPFAGGIRVGGGMTSSSVPAFGRRMAGPAFAPSEIKVYQPNLSKQWRLCALAMVFGLLGLLPLSKILHWLSGGPMPDAQTFLAASCLLFIPFGILLAIGAMRGLPRLIVTPYGVKVERIVVTTWANWDSIEPFVLKTAHAGRFNKQVQSAYAPVIGSHVSKGPLRVKRFILPDHFQTPIGAIAAELNAARAQAVGGDASAPVAAAAPQESPVGLAEFKLPWVTFALLIILVAVFTFENMFPLAPGKELAPSIRTLFGMGALSRTAVLSGGEWYRLFTAPLLHANFAHIAGNGVALLLGGWLLERLIGRLWFFAFFVIGALGGSLMSLAVGPPNLISVGASGALMGLFAALFIGSFRVPAGTASRTRLQVNSMRILIPSLLPIFSSSSVGHIDYGAHFGGAIAGAAAAALLLKFWPKTARIPQARTVAAGIAIIGLLFVVSAGFAVADYPKYDIVIIPQTELPSSIADRHARAATLAARYPQDPRAHLYLGETLSAAKDDAGAEREMRLALTLARTHGAIFGAQFEDATAAVLALFLADHAQRDEAMNLARRMCTVTPGDKGVENLQKLLTDRHLCD
jgi:rhomboid protease GluP